MAFSRRDAPSLRTAYAWLLLWATLWTAAAVRGLDLPLSTHFALLGVGFAGCLVVGVSHRLVVRFGPWRAPPAGTAVAEGLVLSVAAGAGALSGWFPAWGPVASWALLAAALLYAGTLWWQRRGLLPMAACAGGPGDGASRFLLPVAAAYALLAGLAAVRWGFAAPATVHLWLVGFATNAIFLVAHRVLARATTRPLPSRLHWTQAACAAAGPVVLAAALAGWGPAPLGGALEGAAVLLYAVVAVHAGRTRAARGNPLPVLAGVGAVFLVAGAAMGLAFLARPDLLVHLPVHVVNNLVGFVVLTALGFATGMLGLGVRPVPGRTASRSWRLGVATTVLVAAWDAQALLGARHGVVAMLLGLAVGMHAVLGLRIPLPDARPGPPPPAPAAQSS